MRGNSLEKEEQGGDGGGCSIHSVSLVEAGQYRYSLQGDDWPTRVRDASVVHSTERNPYRSRLKIH